MKKIIALLVFICSTYGYAQTLKVSPHLFVSDKKDTVNAELCKLSVPENRTRQDSKTIAISFIRFKSTNPNPGSPIIYLAGGPGGSGIATAKGKRFPIFKKLTEIADVIILDQRGTGLSNTLPDCPNQIEFDMKRPIEKEEYLSKSIVQIKSCLSFWDEKEVDISAYNTTENSKDLEAIRLALGVDKISLWGISYGSHLAFEYIRLFEKNIDKIVLASLEGPDETIKLPKQTEDFLFMLAEKATTNYGSNIKYPDLRSKMEEVHSRAKNNPITTTFKNRKGTIDTVSFSNFELQAVIANFYLKNPEDSKRLPKLYSQMYEGDFSGIAPMIATIKMFGLRKVDPMPFSMDMQSGISVARKKQVASEMDNTILGSTINILFYEWMTNLSFPMLPDAFRKMKANKVNALLLSGTMDGRTYLESGIAIAKNFKNSTHIIVENGGHDLYEQSPVIAEMVFNFFSGKKPSQSKVMLDPIVFE
uniref:alpha/beta fold hydrolase n=1 Tax=Fulvivirga sp. TaxID=1931237 RepID=UPI00404B9D3E